jgi:uncharacterized protein
MSDGTKKPHISAAVFSDTHGNLNAMRDALESQGPFELMIHLGDGVGNGEDVSREFNLPFYGVRGNEDWDWKFPEEQVLTLHTWSFLLVHGHQTEINPYQPREIFDGYVRELQDMAGKEGAQGLLFGHTHRSLLELKDGMILCNPGNQHLGSFDAPTFAKISVDGQSLTVAMMAKKGPGNWVIEKQARFERSLFPSP